LNPTELAYHEAGHAVACVFTLGAAEGIGPDKISIVAKDTALGYIEIEDGDWDWFQERVRKNEVGPKEISMVLTPHIITLMAGYVSQCVYNRKRPFSFFDEYLEAFDSGSSTDFVQIIKISKSIFSFQPNDQAIANLLVDSYESTIRLVYKHWNHIEVIAKYLLENKEMDRKKFCELILPE
jgi:hypothetical protein